jgi:betaine-aldehyde dehydrogenase
MITREYGHFIDGKEQASLSGKTIFRDSPAHGGRIAQFADGTAEDCELALKAARRAFDHGAWSEFSSAERADLLLRLAERMRQEKERLATIEAEEVGKPIRFARGDLDGAIGLITYAAGLAQQIHGETYTNLGPQKYGMILREPVGVAGMIVPWNFPALILCQKLPFALAAGCTAVVKPSEYTSGTTVEIARLLHEVGIPPGVVNVVTGYGIPVGENLATSPLVDFISFTGSTATGKRIMHNAAETGKRVSMELGGKSANLIFSDADLGAAVEAALFGIFFNQGECCCSASRVLVHAAIADEFEAALAKATQRLKVGSPLDESSDLGAMIHEAHFNKVMNYIATGHQERASLLAGGERETRGACGEGFFVQPTIFSEVEPGMKIFREEIFGPVLSITRFRTTEEAIALANDTEYGLANAVWTKSIDTALRVTGSLRSGTVWVNTMLDVPVQMPFGGYQGSGFGREMGTVGLEEFTQTKSVMFHIGQSPTGFQHGNA